MGKEDEEAKQLVKKPTFFPEAMYALVKEAYRDLKGQIFSLSAKQWQTRITENLVTHVRDPTSGTASLLPSPSEETWPACNWSQSRLNLKLRGLSHTQSNYRNSNLHPQQNANSAKKWMEPSIFSPASRRRAWAPSFRSLCPLCSSQRSRSHGPK